VVPEFVDAGTFPVEPTRHRQYIETTHLKMLRKHPIPTVATCVDRFPVVGFIPPVNRVGFRLATAVTVAERAGVTPNTVTAVSVFVAFSASALLYVATPASQIAAVFLVITNGVLDVLDGELARRTGTASARGDLLDHVGDRYADAAVVGGIAGGTGEWLLGTAAVSGVLLVAEAGTAAQAEGIGRIYRGFLTRADISALVVVGGITTASGVRPAGVEAFIVVLFLLTVGGHLTALQRAVAIRRLAGNS